MAPTRTRKRTRTRKDFIDTPTPRAPTSVPWAPPILPRPQPTTSHSSSPTTFNASPPREVTSARRSRQESLLLLLSSIRCKSKFERSFFIGLGHLVLSPAGLPAFEGLLPRRIHELALDHFRKPYKHFPAPFLTWVNTHFSYGFLPRGRGLGLVHVGNQKPILTMEGMFGAFEAVDEAGGHAGFEELLERMRREFASVPRAVVRVFVERCSRCRKRAIEEEENRALAGWLMEWVDFDCGEEEEAASLDERTSSSLAPSTPPFSQSSPRTSSLPALSPSSSSTSSKTPDLDLPPSPPVSVSSLFHLLNPTSALLSTSTADNEPKIQDAFFCGTHHPLSSSPTLLLRNPLQRPHSYSCDATPISDTSFPSFAAFVTSSSPAPRPPTTFIAGPNRRAGFPVSAARNEDRVERKRKRRRTSEEGDEDGRERRRKMEVGMVLGRSGSMEAVMRAGTTRSG